MLEENVYMCVCVFDLPHMSTICLSWVIRELDN